MPTSARSGTTGGDRIDEVLEAMRDLIRSLGGTNGAPIASSTASAATNSARSSRISGSRATWVAPT